jgi:hypothetical protein
MAVVPAFLYILYYIYSIWSISYSASPFGILTVVISPTFLPIKALDIGDKREILPFSALASSCPTI